MHNGICAGGHIFVLRLVIYQAKYFSAPCKTPLCYG